MIKISYLIIVLEPALVGRYPVDQLVGLRLPGRRLPRSRVELVEEEGEGFLVAHRGIYKIVGNLQKTSSPFPSS